jgi:uncharacterized protein YjiS (DUF1127 family)
VFKQMPDHTDVAMADRNEIDFIELENYQALTSDQRNALKARALHRAHAERSEYLKSVLRALGSGLSKLWASPRWIWHTYRARRCWQAEIAELRALDERALRDIGITRFDVECARSNMPGRYDPKLGAR